MFRVVWLQSALNELAVRWMQADQALREAITAASHTLDRRLSTSPAAEGESRAGGVRITFVEPLVVRFQVEPDGRTVTVLNVRLFGHRKR